MGRVLSTYPYHGPLPLYLPASPDGRDLPEPHVCQDAPKGRDRAQSEVPSQPPALPSQDLGQELAHSPSLPAAPGVLSHLLDSSLGTGKKIPQGSVVMGLPQAGWVVLPHFANSQTLLPPHMSEPFHAAPPHLPLTLSPYDPTYLHHCPSPADPPFPCISPSPGPPLTRKSALPSRPWMVPGRP